MFPTNVLRHGFRPVFELPVLALGVTLAIGMAPPAVKAQDGTSAAERTGLALESSPEDEPAGEFSSDRPGFGSSTTIVPVGHLTSEVSMSVATGRGQTQLSFPELLFRAGVTSWLEARLNTPQVLIARGDVDAEGLSDLGLGLAIGGAMGEHFAVSLVPMVSLPVGSAAFSADVALYSMSLNVSATAGPIGILVNGVVASVSTADPVTGDTSRELEGAASFALSLQAHPTVSPFAQVYLLKSQSSDTRVFLGGGVTWMVWPHMQLDLAADFGLTDGTPVAIVSTGWTTLW